MIVEYVNPVNLNLLEDAFNSSMMNSNELSKYFEKNLPLLLSHIKLSFVIRDISIFEAYMLKRFCGGEISDIETSIVDDAISADKFPITNRTLRSLFLLNKNITDDTDVTVKPGVLLFPAKCIEKKCIVTFQGHSILSVIGEITKGHECFFIEVNNEIQNHPEMDKSEIASSLLIKRLVKEFYSFLYHKNMYIDMLSDATLDSAYLQYARSFPDTLACLSHINSIYGDISFVNTDSDKYAQSLSTISQNQESLQIQDKSVIMDTTEIFFLCNTSFYTFMEAFLYLPLNSILESTDIKMVYTSDQYIIPQEMAKFQTRVSSIVEKMKAERMSVRTIKTVKKILANDGSDATEENIDAPNPDSDIYNLIPLNTRIQYSVRFKLSEISDILMTWEDKIKNHNMYGDNDHYLTREILKVINVMKSHAIAVYKTIIR